MARSKHATYTAADRHERRHAARSRRYSRHAQAEILRRRRTYVSTAKPFVEGSRHDAREDHPYERSGKQRCCAECRRRSARARAARIAP